MKFVYLDEIRQLLDTVEAAESTNMECAVEILVTAIERKNSIFIFGASHAGILSEEMYYRAGGLMVINPIFARELMLDTAPITHTSYMERLVGYGRTLGGKVPFKPGDVLIAHSVSGRNPVTVELAMAAQEQGATIIALTNLNYSRAVPSRMPGGKRLFEVADLVLDNHGEKGDACVTIQGIEQKVAPTSTVIGASILNSIVAETTRRLVEGGMSTPPIFYSANIDGGDERNRTLVAEYHDVIHYSY